MPEFEIHGKGIKTGRKRKRTYTADSIEDARAMALKDETEPLEIIPLSAEAEAPPAKKKAAAAKKPRAASVAGKRNKNPESDTAAATPEKSSTAASKHISPIATPAPSTTTETPARPQKVIRKNIVLARSNAVNSPHWASLPKQKKKKSFSLLDPLNLYLLLMIAFLLYIMLYYTNV